MQLAHCKQLETLNARPVPDECDIVMANTMYAVQAIVI